MRGTAVLYECVCAWAGMGCSNGGICIDMAKYLLKSNPETLCLIFNHENMSAGGYMGNDRTMLLPYCLFRVSGAAAFLTNRSGPSDNSWGPKP